MSDTDKLEAEAKLFGRYLLGRRVTVDTQSIQLYQQAMARPGRPHRRDQALLDFALHHHWSLGLLDAGSALVRPKTELRRRLFTLFSILETRPEYAHFFLPKRHTVWHVLGVIFTGGKAVCKVLLGAVLVKVVAR